MSIEKILEKTDNLIGAKEFKAMMHNYAAMSERTKGKSFERVFKKRVYLFSVNDGDGVDTQINCFSELIFACAGKDGGSIRNFRLEPIDVSLSNIPNATPRDVMINTINTENLTDPYGFRVLVIDIRDWMEKCDTAEFRVLISRLRGSLESQRLVFLIPAVDVRTLSRVKECISWFMDVEEVYTPPVSIDEYMEYADRRAKEMDLEFDERSKGMLCELLISERADAQFFGFRTVRRILDEIVIKKVIAENGYIEPMEE